MILCRNYKVYYLRSFVQVVSKVADIVAIAAKMEVNFE